MIKTFCTAPTSYVLLEVCQIKNLGNNSWFSLFAGLIFCWGGTRFSPSPLRGEGWDEEWFNSVLNAANLTPALSLKRRGSKPKPTEKARLRSQ
jgi:hypothetical protein